MQYLEASAIGLRAACLRLKSPAYRTEFLVLPMIHIAMPEFYAAVRAQVARCDVVVCEGVRTFRVWLMTLSYRLMPLRRRLGLVLQRDALVLADLPVERVHGDVTGVEFDASWKRIPWHFRVAVLVLAPLYGAWLYFTASRASIVRRSGRDDLDRSGIFMLNEEFGHAISTDRDSRLAEVLQGLLARDAPPRLVAIVYGGAHMPAVTDLLITRLKFQVAESGWIRAIDIEP